MNRIDHTKAVQRATVHRRIYWLPFESVNVLSSVRFEVQIYPHQWLFGGSKNQQRVLL